MSSKRFEMRSTPATRLLLTSVLLVLTATLSACASPPLPLSVNVTEPCPKPPEKPAAPTWLLNRKLPSKSPLDSWNELVDQLIQNLNSATAKPPSGEPATK